MTRLADFAVRHPRLMLAIVVLAIVVAVPLAGKQAERLTSAGTVSDNSQSAAVSEALEDGEFPGADVAPLAVLLRPEPGARGGDLAAALAQVEERVAQVDDVAIAPEARRRALAAARAEGGGPVVVPLTYGGVGIDQARALSDELGIADGDPGTAAGGRVDVHLIGESALWSAFIERAESDTRAAEARAFPLTALVLLVAFGSLAAAVLPLIVAAIALTVTSAIIYLLTFATSMDIFAATTASLLGLGIAIDYSLFIVVRYREEVRSGFTPDEARRRAMATSGRAVLYSGIVVAIAQSALFLIASPGVRSIGAGAITVVAVSLLVAATVLPLMIAKLGRRAYEPGRLGRWLARRRRGEAADGAFWVRWTGIVMRRPAISLAVSVALLLALAVPTLDLSVRNSATSQLPVDHQVRQGIDFVTEQEGVGALAPVRIMVTAPDERVDPATVRSVAEAAARDPAVTRVAETRTSRDGDRALVTALLGVPSDSQAARDAVDRLRDALPAAAGRAAIDVGGATAVILDFDRLVTEELWRPILFVLVASFVVLLVLLRSVVLPIKAALMTLLSVLAAYGALVGVFKHGWLEFAGVEPAATIYPITLPLVFTLVFGLSMDYHIFMLSRIQERYNATGDTRRAVGEALARSGRPITNAALIMVVVFLAFVTAGAPSIQQLGFAAAVAIAIDATIVRLVLVPAAMELLGRWNWWLPRPLERVLRARPIARLGEHEPVPEAPRP